ncbi:protein of unknown function [Mesotoga infera]|uniref:Uncharacterized protein n=1 Tax=Mesotoga infera TaxID=1236046 RepID=A0A7Z7LEN6_9BACT|nr:protein of unknown function [Mesotoga infera]
MIDTLTCIGQETRFQTTYEELKHGCCVMVSLAGLSFQTTYEELKRVNEPALPLAGGASRLPMRN